MARAYTKIGDVFSVKLDDHQKKYFQLIAYDLTQLNSGVIGAFKTAYPPDDSPTLTDIVKDEVDFYAHCVTKFGLKMNLWDKVGSSKELGCLDGILFRDTNDYGTKVGEKRVEISDKWFIWHINDEKFTRVGKLEGENRKAYVGLVFNPLGIIGLLKGNKYPINYPDFE
ncbi:MAG: hypothetical protein ABL933_18375 [Methyloglobulus sp.]|nr:hypothetical protein [Methyloglobulus sp.]